MERINSKCPRCGHRYTVRDYRKEKLVIVTENIVGRIEDCCDLFMFTKLDLIKNLGLFIK